MKLHSKTITILVGTLIIGIAIGALGWSNIHNQRQKRLAEMRRQGGLYGSIDRYIDPVDSLQEVRLRELTSAYQDTLDRFWRHYLWHRAKLMQEFEQQLLPVLEEEQEIDIRDYLDRITKLPRSARRDSTRSETTDSTSQEGAGAQRDDASGQGS